MFRAQDSEVFAPAAAASARPAFGVRSAGAPMGTPAAAVSADRADPASGWAVDLAQDIGSRRWYRGMATLILLIGLALACWPDLSALEAAPASRVDAVAAGQFRSLGLSAARPMAPPSALPAHPALRQVAFVAERPQIERSAELPAGDSIGRLLQRAGVSGSDAARASELIAGAVPLDRIAPGTRFSLVLGPRPAPGQPRRLERATLRARIDLALAVTRSGGGLTLQRQAIPVDTTPVRIRGQVGSSLYRSARAAGVPPSAIQQYLAALDSHLSLEGDIGPDDAFDLVFAYKRAATGESEAGELLYAGLERATPRGRRPVLELLRWGQDGGFYSAETLSRPSYVQTGPGLLMPVNGHVTSLYGQRFHPILGYTRMHAGVDFGAAWGSPIVATADGVVSYAGYHGGHGMYVRLEHGGSLGTGYGHMSRIMVWPGQRVRAGEVIGLVGSSGLSTGPHLHYEMYRDGQTVDPLGTRFAAVTRQVDPRELGAFRTRLAQLKALQPGALLASGVRAVSQLALR
ncbi:M23 family metallopeptidase [Novosphingobium flavum]|uniref:peptidoglycan DD-metalloendopeptidase family protein n=1 Tax=Novosphingobium aerophilum TaxID=2839843 RepID=UPI0016398560|nr:M23 family metallopeptidase [Novosphingobium aerophilum]